jgi:hypothetical protein
MDLLPIWFLQVCFGVSGWVCRRWIGDGRFRRFWIGDGRFSWRFTTGSGFSFRLPPHLRWWSVVWWLLDLGVIGGRSFRRRNGGDEMVLRRGGVEKLMCWIWRLMSFVFSFPGYLNLWPCSNLLRFAGFFQVADDFQICWDLQDSCIWLKSTASVSNVSPLSTGVHQLLTQWAAFWILMDRALLIRVRELVSSGISMSWVGVLSGGHWCFSIVVS